MMNDPIDNNNICHKVLLRVYNQNEHQPCYKNMEAHAIFYKWKVKHYDLLIGKTICDYHAPQL